MSELLRCPHGHEWEPEADGSPDRCPVCAAGPTTLTFPPEPVKRVPPTRPHSDSTLRLDGPAPDGSAALESPPAAPEHTLADEPAPGPEATLGLDGSASADAAPADATLALPGSPPTNPGAAPDATLSLADPPPTAASDADFSLATRAISQRPGSRDNTLSAPGLPPAGGPAATQITPSRTLDLSGPRPTVAGYDIVGELGRGGMGVVYKAWQGSLNRYVALKMILAGGHASAHDLARFYTEAKAVAQLQHPNVVQIYEIGQQDGCPFFSLEFVDGGSLAQKYAGVPLDARKAAELVEQLARAMDAAHRRGIIHRDLKPANILLTTDGVPKITDFGLAKKFEEDDGQTRTGSIMGTPSYMAPEQAEGRTQELGPAADIYALGAILYDLVAGRPPFRGETVLDTLQQVKSLAPVPPSRFHRKLPRDLETIVLKCLHKESRKRYATAGDLADDLRRFLDGEPIKARPTPAWERAWLWAKRRPAAAALIGVSVLSLLALSGGGFAYALHAHALRTEAERARETAEEQERLAIAGRREAEWERGKAREAEKLANDRRAEAEEQRQQALEQKRRAEEQRQRAAANFRTSVEAVDQLLTRIGQERLANEPRMELVRRDLLERALKFHQRFLKTDSADPEVRWEAGRAYLRVGDIQEQLGRLDKAQEAYVQGLALLDKLAEEHSDRPKFQKDQAEGYGKLSVVLQARGKPGEAEDAYRKSFAIRKELAERHSNVPDYQHALAVGYRMRGVQLQLRGDPDGAADAYRQAILRFDRLASDHAGIPEYRQELGETYINLATLLLTAGKVKAAERAYRDALVPLGRLVEQHSEDRGYREHLGRAYLNLAALLYDDHRPAEAERSLQKARELFAKLAEDYPTVADYRQYLGMCFNTLGAILRATGRAPDAERMWRDAVAVFGRLAREFPALPGYRQEQARAQHNLGILLTDLNRPDDAQAEHRAALELRQQLAAGYPDEWVYRVELASSHGRLAVAQARGNQLKKSEDSFRRAIAVLDEAEGRFPDQPAIWAEQARHQGDLAALLTALSRPRDAEPCLRSRATAQEKLAAKFPDEAQRQADVGTTWQRLGRLLLARDAAAEAVKCLERSAGRWRAAWERGRAAAHQAAWCAACLDLGRAQVQDHDHAAADRTAAELAKSAPANWPGFAEAAAVSAGCAALAEKDEKLPAAKRKALARAYGDRAMALLRKATAAGFKDAGRLKGDEFKPLREREDFKELLAQLGRK